MVREVTVGDQHRGSADGAGVPVAARAATSPAEASPAGYATGRATKQSIVESAARAFSVTGFYGTSLRSIAREAGIDHSTLIHHFGNKTALLLAVIEWQDRRNLAAEAIEATDAAAAARGLTAEEMADQLAATAARNAEAPGLVQLLSVLTAEAGAEGHPAREPLRRRHEALADLITERIEQQRAAGAPDDGLSPREHAALVVSTWEGLQTYDALHPGEVDVPALLRRTVRQAFGLD